MKTIKEAARVYALLQGPFCCDCTELREAFIAGAYYARIDGWHKPDEETPEGYVSVLLAYLDGSIIIGYYDPSREIWRSAHSHGEIFEPAAWRLIPEYK